MGLSLEESLFESLDSPSKLYLYTSFYNYKTLILPFCNNGLKFCVLSFCVVRQNDVVTTECQLTSYIGSCCSFKSLPSYIYKRHKSINLKDGRDLTEAYSLHTIYAMTPSNIQPCAKKKLRSVPHQKCQYERKCGGNKR